MLDDEDTEVFCRETRSGEREGGERKSEKARKRVNSTRFSFDYFILVSRHFYHQISFTLRCRDIEYRQCRRCSPVTNDEAAKKLIYGKRILQRVARVKESEGGDGPRAVCRQSTSTCRPSRGNHNDISRSVPAPPETVSCSTFVRLYCPPSVHVVVKRRVTVIYACKYTWTPVRPQHVDTTLYSFPSCFSRPQERPRG